MDIFCIYCTIEKCKIPEGTQTDTKFRIKGKGFKNPNSNIAGDFIFTVIVKTPKKLTKEQRELIVLLNIRREERSQIHSNYTYKLSQKIKEIVLNLE